MRKTFVALALLLLASAAPARKPKVKDLIASFEAAKTDERLRLAGTLARMKDKKAVDALLRAFDVKKGNPRESAAYVDAFGVAGDPRAVEPLAAAWDYLRSLILQMGELPGHLQVLRWKILDALSRLGGDQAVRILSEALNDSDPRVVEEAVRGLGRLQVRDAVPALQQLAAGATGNLLQAVFEALGDIGDKRALSTLEQAVTNPDKFIEVEVSYALAKLGRKDALARLNGFLKGDPGEDKVGLLSAYYLVKLDKDAGLEHLEAMMKKPDSPLAPLAAETLGKTENPRAVLVLVEAFKAPDPAVRLAVTRSLVRLGGPRAASALKKLRGDSNPGVRSAAINGLADLGEID
ncbi:MAG: HEAT repeat domain-containing protein [Elusimicrobia bacterium]|nr:HEAT repeat domain-containing protein [Elusimicrobiota bacterium]